MRVEAPAAVSKHPPAARAWVVPGSKYQRPGVLSLLEAERI